MHLKGESSTEMQSLPGSLIPRNLNRESMLNNVYNDIHFGFNAFLQSIKRKRGRINDLADPYNGIMSDNTRGFLLKFLLICPQSPLWSGAWRLVLYSARGIDER
jgi:hypothetical protein